MTFSGRRRIVALEPRSFQSRLSRITPVKARPDRLMSVLNPEGDVFRAATRELAAGVSAISCRHSGRLAGFIAPSVSSLSVDPPSLIICVNRSSSSWPALVGAECFGVNILSSTHHELADRCSGSGDAEAAQRFENANWVTLRTGAPLLEDALASFDCTVEEIIERYDRAIVIGRVEAVRQHGGGGALIYWRGAYDQLGWSPEEISNALGPASDDRSRAPVVRIQDTDRMS